PHRAPGARCDRLHRGVPAVAVADQGACPGVGLGDTRRPPGPGGGVSMPPRPPRIDTGLSSPTFPDQAGLDSPTSMETSALRSAVRDLLGKQPDSAWPRLAREIGVAGLAIPESYGGSGATLRETCVVLEELGRTLTPAPLLGSAVLAGTALLGTGDTDACGRPAPGIAAGPRAAPLA